jgi:hypothetical protein
LRLSRRSSPCCSLPATPAPSSIWRDDCGLNGTSNLNFACDTDLGTDVIVGSVIVPPGVTALTGMEPTVLVVFDHGALPPWWTFGAAPNCRAASSLASAYPGGSVPGSCNTYFADNGAAGAHLPDANPPSPDRLRIRMVAAIDVGLAGPVPAGEEIYLFTLTIDPQRTTSGCAGCGIPATFNFSDLTLTQLVGVGDFDWTADLERGDLCAYWNDGICWGCCVVPAANTTWGQVQALYR